MVSRVKHRAEAVRTKSERECRNRANGCLSVLWWNTEQSFVFSLGRSKHAGQPRRSGVFRKKLEDVAAINPLQRLRNRIESALGRAGLPAEGRKFHPHVSLGRPKQADARHVAEFEIFNGLFSLREIPVQEFCLCSSELRPGGAVHTVEESYRLEGILEGEEEA